MLFDANRYRTEQPFRWMWQVWRLLTAECWLRSQAQTETDTLRTEPQASARRVTLRSVPTQ